MRIEICIDPEKYGDDKIRISVFSSDNQYVLGVFCDNPVRSEYLRYLEDRAYRILEMQKYQRSLPVVSRKATDGVHGPRS